MIIILSGQYVEQDLRAEFGEIPPVFLPVGNKRLYNYLIDNIRKNNPNGKICITIPENYEINDWDRDSLIGLNVSLLKVNESFSLGQSLAFALSSLNALEEGVLIYYGDTLLYKALNKIDYNKNIIFTANTEYNYLWHQIDKGPLDTQLIFCGVLSIAKPIELIQYLISTHFNFESTLKKYYEKNEFEYEKRDDWLDFGHLNTFYDSKTIVTTQRAFNKLKINKNFVEKESNKKFKLEAEANWFINTPEILIPHTPRLISSHETPSSFSYKLEYLYCPTLTEIFVFGNHPISIWARIIKSCFQFVETCNTIPGKSKVDFYQALTEKNRSRLSEFIEANPRFAQDVYDENNNSYNLSSMLEYCHSLINKESKITFVHGDFCFSNILYDFKKNDIKVIDPRGTSFDDEICVYGDVRYDLAKVLHSAIGKYDFIISDRFKIRDDGRAISLVLPDHTIDLTELIKHQFERSEYDYREILAITATLFISMLPLHYDRPDRQLGFIVTAINLYKELNK